MDIFVWNYLKLIEILRISIKYLIYYKTQNYKRIVLVNCYGNVGKLCEKIFHFKYIRITRKYDKYDSIKFYFRSIIKFYFSGSIKNNFLEFFIF